MRKQCKKCGYTRKEVEYPKEHECPNCGIIYDKYEARLQKTIDIIDESQVTKLDTKGVKIQNIIILIYIITLIMLALFPPFHVQTKYGMFPLGNKFIFSKTYAIIDISTFALQIITLSIVTFVVFFFLKDSKIRLFSKLINKVVGTVTNIGKVEQENVAAIQNNPVMESDKVEKTPKKFSFGLGNTIIMLAMGVIMFIAGKGVGPFGVFVVLVLWLLGDWAFDKLRKKI